MGNDFDRVDLVNTNERSAVRGDPHNDLDGLGLANRMSFETLKHSSHSIGLGSSGRVGG